MRYPIQAAVALAFALAGLGCSTTTIAKDAPSKDPAAVRPAPERTFTRAELTEDFDQVSKVLLTRNPLAFADKAELTSFIESKRRQLRNGMNELDFYRVLTPVIVKSGCGHSGIFLTPETEARLKANQRYLPILVRIVGDRLFVLSPLGAEGPASGSEITAINGRPIPDILSLMYENVTADGSNGTRRVYVASRVFNDLYPLFVDLAPRFRVAYLSAGDGRAGELSLEGIPKAELEREAAEAGFPYGLPESGPAYSFAAEGPGPALLSIRSFIIANAAEMTKYKEFIDRAFDGIRSRDAKALVLDLRGNWGGDPEASAYLFQHLLDRSEPYFASGTSFYPALTHPLPPTPNAFTGKLIVLIDGACFSSTGHVCSLLRYLGRATFVGEETGGSWVATDNSRDTYLPATGMRFRSSTMAFKTAVVGLPLGRGIMPDRELSPGIEDFIAHRDPVLQTGLELASRNS